MTSGNHTTFHACALRTAPLSVISVFPNKNPALTHRVRKTRTRLSALTPVPFSHPFFFSNPTMNSASAFAPSIGIAL